ncbi:XRE family transcriptional regulator [Pseudomonas aeruginosa]|uniref:XRE family transcriptional regulator n=1 Tax=Pseudomonas aeruginosa TaxID=287 RepID=UPI00295179C1|nr:XRE family transcriptional regulator [Pseudomonas aeruginosa]MDV6551293.1 helix-turn-helix domain-containing protein [Pseudomonas aeruginosa]MDV6585558.1 helix-turn-helix domain-containing protein [Pseudomonas aeruginosa]MDV6725332.1 helix-turn-helix domain-containing protein [Pseudomonas aeruginosa]WPD47103.1 XRE family transcriptional regulator [Pseudomonas aeruginosa]
MSALKDRIKLARKHADLTQRQLAEAVGVSQPVISQLEKGENLQSVHLLKIANVCGVDPEWLAEGTGQPPGLSVREPSAEYQAASSAADIVRSMLASKAAQKLSAEARERILNAAESDAGPAESNVIRADFSRPGLVGDEISIAHYDIRGAMGGGQVPADYAEMLRDVKVSQQHLRELGVTYDDPNHLKMVHGWGQSMEPTIKHRDPLIVDISIQQFTGDGIYLFTWQGHLYIKRLQVEDADHFEMISDNKKHKDRSIRVDETYIHARVLLVWNANLV